MPAELSVLKLIVETIVGVVAVGLVIVLLRDRRSSRKNNLADRSEERRLLAGLAENAIGHSTAALEKVAAATERDAEALRELGASQDRLAVAVEGMGKLIANCPYQTGKAES